MNINELEELTKQWSASEPEEYPAAVLELIAAYREAVAVLRETFALCDDFHDDPPPFHKISKALATAKRLGVE